MNPLERHSSFCMKRYDLQLLCDSFILIRSGYDADIRLWNESGKGYNKGLTHSLNKSQWTLLHALFSSKTFQRLSLMLEVLGALEMHPCVSLPYISGAMDVFSLLSYQASRGKPSQANRRRQTWQSMFSQKRGILSSFVPTCKCHSAMASTRW